mmetsp:Transcript_14355/g.34281  ORF Transcript_14355/g.34281 Transcript_14355/m.34281 type:complete len:102 (-) Transcript_14355:853-1158(-)
MHATPTTPPPSVYSAGDVRSFSPSASSSSSSSLWPASSRTHSVHSLIKIVTMASLALIKRGREERDTEKLCACMYRRQTDRQTDRPNLSHQCSEAKASTEV